MTSRLKKRSDRGQSVSETSVLSYKDAGVDRDKADRLVGWIDKETQKWRLHPKIKSVVGGYASLYAVRKDEYIAATTDGVGTKLKLAFELGKHDTVGIDLVAMSVNDLICVGAKPLFFLDYFATGKLSSSIAQEVLSGIIKGCLDSDCALVGGETAEMPSLYSDGEYDLAGFAVGTVPSQNVLPKSAKGKNGLRKGDVLLGIASSGCHSNGYSLLRRLLDGLPKPERRRRALDLLTPTALYPRAVASLSGHPGVLGMAHITGSGFLNVPRISDQFGYHVVLPKASDVAPVWDWVRHRSRLGLGELASTFNLGIGLVIAVRKEDAESLRVQLVKNKQKVYILGEVIPRDPKKGAFVRVVDPASRGQVDLWYT